MCQLLRSTFRSVGSEGFNEQLVELRSSVFASKTQIDLQLISSPDSQGSWYLGIMSQLRQPTLHTFRGPTISGPPVVPHSKNRGSTWGGHICPDRTTRSPSSPNGDPDCASYQPRLDNLWKGGHTTDSVQVCHLGCPSCENRSSRENPKRISGA